MNSMYFNQLNEILPQGVDFTMTVRKEEKGMVVIVRTRMEGLHDPAQHAINPLILREATPEELDNGFFNEISRPVVESSGLLLNMKEFESSMDRANEQAREAKEKEAQITKEEREKEKKYNKVYHNAVKLEEEGKLKDALSKYQECLSLVSEKDKKVIEEKIKNLKGKLSGGSLFDEFENNNKEVLSQMESTDVTPPDEKSEALSTIIADVKNEKESVQETTPTLFDAEKEEKLAGFDEDKDNSSQNHHTTEDLFTREVDPFDAITAEPMLPRDEFIDYPESATSLPRQTIRPITLSEIAV